MTRPWRATGADLPFGDPTAAHPGVALESYCWRIVDAARRRSLMLAVTRCQDADGGPWASAVLAVLGPRGGRTVAERSFDAVELDPDGLGLVCDGGAVSAGPGHLRADLGGGVGLDVTLRDRRGWPRRSLGGLGLGHVVPGLSQYWHPHLLGAEVRGEVRTGSASRSLDGATAYGEKNWGRGGTPSAWWWGQAAFAPDAMLAFAGGVLDVGPAGVPATALVVRAGDDLAAFSPPFGWVRVQGDTTEMRVQARSATWRAQIETELSSAPFALPVPVLGSRDLRLASHQHQDGRLRLRLLRGRRLVLDAETDLAALERGGGPG